MSNPPVTGKRCWKIDGVAKRAPADSKSDLLASVETVYFRAHNCDEAKRYAIARFPEAKDITLQRVDCAEAQDMIESLHGSSRPNITVLKSSSTEMTVE